MERKIPTISGDRLQLLGGLEARVGHTFADPSILDRALTHRSFAHEHESEGFRHNESFELLGDSILGFLICEWLLERFPDEDEGRLSKMKAFLVSERTLDQVARDVELGQYLRLNRGEEKTGGREKRAILVDSFEALVAAVYLDGGLTAVRNFVRDCFVPQFALINPDDLTATDYKSALQEALQASGLRVPSYRVSDVIGPDHRRTFRVDVVVEGELFAQGEGQSIKRAEQEAARRAIDRLLTETEDGDLPLPEDEESVDGSPSEIEPLPEDESLRGGESQE
jgi:ribonuclease-3